MASTNGARSRGLGINKVDMDASRLVFVFVRDSKPRRKVAVPVPESYTWQQFLDQVKSKLKIGGVGDIYLASSGQKVRDLRELQDIDELCVVEAPSDLVNSNGFAHAGAEPSRTGSGLGTGSEIRPQSSDGASTAVASGAAHMMRQPSLRVGVDGVGGGGPQASTSYGDEGESKYQKRGHPLKRSLQTMFPSLFAPGLPVTMKDAQGEGGGQPTAAARRRRKRAAGLDLRTALIMLLFMTFMVSMLFLLTKVSQRASEPAP